ncbi:glucosyltransferase domain-containing protein [Citrobacter portucalensis]|uniref:glucosyltransferase domain-containing protein n=1 Tax=Citrobacter portucalensis TaxID=1639133 RepID=UPI0023B33549|nr:glucosyltransferase domain-containing protein [Citrobacter portucalensis]MDE9691045.1 glucosyltransferase domain-containing protein [Citrobacter portucalensis]
MKPKTDPATSSRATKMHLNKYSVYFFAGVSLLYALPFILHSNLYLDDVYRSVYGDGSWSPLGRPLADMITFGLSLNRFYLSDFYPLGIIIAIIIFTCIIYFIIEKELSVISGYALIPLPTLFASPIFLQNMSYHYDSTAMTIALSMGVLAFYLSCSRGVFYNILSIISLIASLSLYQPCANIFLGLMAANVIIKIKNSKNLKLKQFILDSALFCCSLLIYYLFVVKLFSLGGQRASFIEPSNIISSLILAFKGVCNISSLILTGFMKIVFHILVASAAISIIAAIIKIKPRFSDLSSALLRFSLSIILLFFSAIGTSFLVVEGITDIRVMVGLSSVVFFLLVISLRELNLKASFALVSFILLPVVSLSFQYVNASSYQRDFELSILTNVSRDVDYGANGSVYISGTMPLSPQAKVAINAVPFIGRVMPPSPPWVSRRLAVSVGINSIENSWGGDNLDLISKVCDENLRPLITNQLYSIYKISDKNLAYFKGNSNICD